MALGSEHAEEPGEVVFRTDLRHVPWWRILACGAVVGLCGWLLVDRDVSWHRLLTWAAIGAAGFSVYLLPQVQRTLLEEIRVRPDGFTVVRKGSTREYAWSDLEAAYFELYPVVNLGQHLHYFRFRAGGRNREVCLDGLDDRTRQACCATLGAFLRTHRVPERSPELSTFQTQLSHSAAWVFVLSAFGMLAAHFFACHTLGTIFGLSFMLTGTCMALMSRRERLSRLVLAATAILVVAVGLIIWAFQIDVRAVLQDWETRERRLGRPPWKAVNPRPRAREKADSRESLPALNHAGALPARPYGVRALDAGCRDSVPCSPRPTC